MALAACCVLFTAATGLASSPPGVNALARRLVDDQWAVPLVLLVTTTTAAYLWWVHRQLSPARTASPLPSWQTLLPAALVAGIVLLGGFWLLEEYASAVGRGRAQEVARGVDRLARTVVLSPTPLGIDAPGVGGAPRRAGVAPRSDTAPPACDCWLAPAARSFGARRVVADDGHGHRPPGPGRPHFGSPADRASCLATCPGVRGIDQVDDDGRQLTGGNVGNRHLLEDRSQVRPHRDPHVAKR